MRPARSTHLSINLLPQDPFYETPIGRVMAWASTVGRYLVIFTELIVIVSFASRFKLDRDLTDLNTAIQQKSQIIQSYGELENDVRLTQTKSQFLAQQLANHNPVELLDLVTQNLPSDVVLTLVQIYPTEVQVTGSATTPEALARLVRNLQQQPLVDQLFMDQIKSNTQGGAGFEFILRLQLKKSAAAAASTPAPATKKPASNAGATDL
jgi:Tfp pilus assembly protein PilN